MRARETHEDIRIARSRVMVASREHIASVYRGILGVFVVLSEVTAGACVFSRIMNGHRRALYGTHGEATRLGYQNGGLADNKALQKF